MIFLCNPGMLRVPIAQALHGGASDCRNRTLHQLFLLINLGERAGSGLPKIRTGWESAGHVMRLFDTLEPFDQTRLEMDWLTVTDSDVTKTTGKTTDRILAVLKLKPTASIPELAKQLETTEFTIERTIRQLRETGRIRWVGAAKGGHWEVLESL